MRKPCGISWPGPFSDNATNRLQFRVINANGGPFRAPVGSETVNRWMSVHPTTGVVAICAMAYP